MNYICGECGETFDEPDYYEEHHPYGMTTAAERFSICPHCGSEHIGEPKKCSECGEYFYELRNGMCEECYEEYYKDE